MIVFYVYLLIINITAFVIYGADKNRARRGQWRVPEKSLILLAALGGSCGAFAGMHLFRHKTKKPLFYIGIPVILLCQAGIWIAVSRLY